MCNLQKYRLFKLKLEVLLGYMKRDLILNPDNFFLNINWIQFFNCNIKPFLHLFVYIVAYLYFGYEEFYTKNVRLFLLSCLLPTRWRHIKSENLQ